MFFAVSSICLQEIEYWVSHLDEVVMSNNLEIVHVYLIYFKKGFCYIIINWCAVVFNIRQVFYLIW